MPGVSIYIIAWAPHLLSQVVSHNSQQPSHPWFFICCFLPPALRYHFLDPKSLNPFPCPWEGEILRQLPGGRWQESLQLSAGFAELGLSGLLPAQRWAPAWEPRAVQQLQLSHREGQGKPLSHRVLLLLLLPKVLPVRKCQSCCPIAQDFSCSFTKTFVLFILEWKGNGCHNHGSAALM